MSRLTFVLTILASALGVFVGCAGLAPDDPGSASLDAGDADASGKDARDASGISGDASDAGASYDGADAPRSPDAGGCDSGDFYVGITDAGAAFASITAALAAANGSCAATKTIYVGAGTYTAATGEIFPLVLRGVSLIGVGATSPIIEGTGPIANLAAPDDVSATSSPVAATLQIGSPTETTVVRNLEIASPAQYAPGTEAIVCDEGNVSSTGLSLANTLVDGVTLEWFEIGVRVMSVPPSLGCNLRLNDSHIEHGAVGVYARGNDGVPVSVQVDGQNVFANLSIPSGPLAINGGAVLIYDYVSELTARDNQIADCDQAILVYNLTSGPTVAVDIEGNEIARMGNQAIALVGPLSVTLVGNSVTGTFATSSSLGIGLLVDIKSSSVPAIKRARNNVFVSNDVAVFFRDTSYAGSLAGLAGTDFGTPGDPGNNTFRCSKTANENVVFDLGAASSDDAGVMTFPFEGNVWDRAPPVSGTDFLVIGAVVDTSGATAESPSTCP